VRGRAEGSRRGQLPELPFWSGAGHWANKALLDNTKCPVMQHSSESVRIPNYMVTGSLSSPARITVVSSDTGLNPIFYIAHTSLAVHYNYLRSFENGTKRERKTERRTERDAGVLSDQLNHDLWTGQGIFFIHNSTNCLCVLGWEYTRGKAAKILDFAQFRCHITTFVSCPLRL
jgi:hypothetical protein